LSLANAGPATSRPTDKSKTRMKLSRFRSLSADTPGTERFPSVTPGDKKVQPGENRKG
jgi:hypothetical protein